MYGVGHVAAMRSLSFTPYPTGMVGHQGLELMKAGGTLHHLPEARFGKKQRASIINYSVLVFLHYP